MNAKLKLIVNNEAIVATTSHDRPIRIFYYNAFTRDGNAFDRASRAKTLVGAVRAAIVKVVLGEVSYVRIYHEDGYHMVTICRTTSAHAKKQHVEIFGYFGGV